VTTKGWIGTQALKPGGEGYDEFAIDESHLAAKAVTRAKLSDAVVADLDVNDEDLASALEALLSEVTQLRDLVYLITA
jgi:hypothetical protein